MRENTPPHQKDISEEEGEEIILDDDVPPDDDYDIEEMEEVDADDLERILGGEDSELRVPEEDVSVNTFNKHTSAVFSCSLHPSKDWAVTGGEDDKAFVWNTKTGETLHEIDEHKDTIISTCFSKDGGYLATGDMAGEIKVFKIVEDLKKVWEYSMGDMCWMKWHFAANVLLAGSESGEIYIWRIPSGDCKILPGFGHKSETAELTGDGKKLFAGYGDGSLRLWDVKNTSAVVEVTSSHPMAHTDNVSAVSCDIDSPLYMSGGEDGRILFVSNNGPVGVVEAEGSVECVAFSPSHELKVAASGTLHGQIAIWDCSKMSIRTVCEHPEPDDGVTILKWLPNHILLAGTLQGNIFGYDGRSGERRFSLSGHAAEIYSMEYNPVEGILLTASEDKTAKLFKCPPL